MKRLFTLIVVVCLSVSFIFLGGPSVNADSEAVGVVSNILQELNSNVSVVGVSKDTVVNANSLKSFKETVYYIELKTHVMPYNIHSSKDWQEYLFYMARKYNVVDEIKHSLYEVPMILAKHGYDLNSGYDFVFTIAIKKVKGKWYALDGAFPTGDKFDLKSYLKDLVEPYSYSNSSLSWGNSWGYNAYSYWLATDYALKYATTPNKKYRFLMM